MGRVRPTSSPLRPYGVVLGKPGVRSLILVSLLARIPVTAAPVVLTLHVVLDLHRGFGESGAIAALIALGAALGSPLLGRGIDRIGLRPILVLTTVVDALFWLAAAELSYVWLLPAAFVGGFLALPVFTISRQSLAALLPPTERQAGFALDSMSVEISYAIGPAMGVVLVTQAGSTIAFVSAAVLIFAAGIALIVLDPPVRGEEGADPEFGASRRTIVVAEATPSIRSWFGLRVFAVMLATFGATFTLAGTDTALTASMRSMHTIGMLGVVVAVWCMASLAGGFIYGAVGRPIDPLVLLTGLAGLTVIMAFAPSWWVLALLSIPSGLFCAPLLSSSAQVLTQLTPASVRGQVLGLHSSALTIGNAAGAPLVGIIVDRSAPALGFVGIGALGFALAVVALTGQSWRRRLVRSAHALAA